MAFKIVINDEVAFESDTSIDNVLITGSLGAIARVDGTSMRIIKITVNEKDGINPILDEVEVKPPVTTKPKKRTKKSTAFKAHEVKPKVSKSGQEIDDDEPTEYGSN